MQSLLLLVVVLGVAGSQACKYYCKAPDDVSYICCDDQYPSYLSEDNDEESTKSNAVPAASNCFYYCAYDGDVYCCADNSRPIPASHEPHPGRCPEETEQVCKSSGIFYLTRKVKLGKTSGALQLASKDGKQLDSCASDGYCKQDEKCCPSKCGRKHVCLKSLKDEVE